MSEPSISVQELDTLVKKTFELRAEKEALEEQVKDKNKELTALQSQIVAALKEHGRENYQSPAGTIYISQKWRVNLPKTEEEKKAMFAKLRDMGIFWEYATVNSNSLNSLVMREWEAAKERGDGMTFAFPGVGQPELYETVGMRKK